MMTRAAPNTDTITRAVALASRAPSVHNSQPWRWRYDKAGLKLYSNPYNAVPVTDPAGRELLLSCGAVLHHLQAAMAGMGFQSVIERYPNPNDPRLLARVEFVDKVFVTDAERERIAAMQRRYSDRLPLKAPRDWPAFETVLHHIVGDDVTMTVVSDELRTELENASALVESMRRYDSRYHAELHWWAGHTFGSVGIPTEALASADESARVAVGRQFPRNNPERRRVDVTEDRATVVILSTETDTARDVLQCGEVLSAVLLEATMAGYATCPLTHLVELPDSRLIVQKIVDGTSLPQVLVRIGAAPQTGLPSTTTPRLNVSQILESGI